jgi:hypothetical protein
LVNICTLTSCEVPRSSPQTASLCWGFLCLFRCTTVVYRSCLSAESEDLTRQLGCCVFIMTLVLMSRENSGVGFPKTSTLCGTKSKTVPLQPCRRQGESRCSSYSFLTSAVDGGEWSASRPGRALLPGKGSPVPIVQESGWASELVWTQKLEEKLFASPGIESRSSSLQSDRKKMVYKSNHF